MMPRVARSPQRPRALVIEPRAGRRSGAKLLNEAWRIAANIGKLPELLAAARTDSQRRNH
jgi:hypothetical protein